MKILIAEDDEPSREMLSRRLERSGYQIRVAENGKIALEMIQKDPPDLVIMDLSMPVMTGWEATQRLRQTEAGSRIPVIALTAHAIPEEREKALAAGCDDYDTKPVELERLLGKIRALTSQHRAQ